MSELKVGVMGCADIAKRFVIAAIKAVPDCKLLAIASRDELKSREFAKAFDCEAVCGYDKLLEMDEIDAVYMPLPTGLHEEWMIKAARAGKHILAEKSLALDYESAMRIGKAAQKNNVVIMENYMFQFHSQQRRIMDIIKSGELGEIRIFRASFGFPPLPADNFRYNAALGGGCLLDAAGYPLMACQLFFGRDIKMEASFLKYDQERNVDIFGSALLKINTEDGAFPAEISFGFDNYYQCGYEIWGSKGKLTAHRAFTAGPGIMPLITIEKQGEKHEYILSADNHFNNAIAHFKKAVAIGNLTEELDKVLNQAKLQQEVRDYATEK